MAALFGSMLLFTATQRVELNGDEISYQNLFKRRRSLRLDQIRSAQGIMGAPPRRERSYLVIEPIDPEAPPMKIRMDFFSHADVQTIRNFFGDKLKALRKEEMIAASPSTRFPKFVIRLRIFANELRKAKGTSKFMMLVPLFDFAVPVRVCRG